MGSGFADAADVVRCLARKERAYYSCLRLAVKAL
jgi:hypothetical protein